jgi:hypothetical protein
MVRQVSPMPRWARRYEAQGHGHPRESIADLWAEIDTLAARIDELGTLAVQHPPTLCLHIED